MAEIDEHTRTELEAAAFRRLVSHFRERTDVQNVDVMKLAGFCRNCLSKWYRAAAEERGARVVVVGLGDAEAARDRETRGELELEERAGRPCEVVGAAVGDAVLE